MQLAKLVDSEDGETEQQDLTSIWEEFDIQMEIMYHNDYYENITIKNEIKNTDGKI
jgi:hypothetical protein